MTLLACRLSKSPPATPIDKLTDYATTPPGWPGGSPKKLTDPRGSWRKPYFRLSLTSFFHFLVSFLTFLALSPPTPPPATPCDKFTDYAKPPPGRPGGGFRGPYFRVSPLVSSVFGVVFVSKSPSFASAANKFKDYAKPPPGRPGGSWRKLTEPRGSLRRPYLRLPP